MSEGFFQGKEGRKDPTGSRLSNYESIVSLQKQLDDLKKRCCCGNNFGFTTLSPPVDPPGIGDPNVLFNRTTGEEWYWDGANWVQRYGQAYKVISGALSQSGINPPVFDYVYENTIGNVSWIQYPFGLPGQWQLISPDPIFTQYKTVFVQNGMLQNVLPGATFKIIYTDSGDPYSMIFDFTDEAFNLITETSVFYFEVRVYP